MRGDRLGEGPAQVLAALIRLTASGPTTYGQLQRSTGLSRTRIRRCVAALAAEDLLDRTPSGPWPKVTPLTVEQARSDYTEERRADLRKQADPSSASDPRTQESNGQ